MTSARALRRLAPGSRPCRPDGAIGGRYGKMCHGFFGIACEAALRADVAFLSSSAIHGASAFHQNQEVVQSKRLMIAAAERPIFRPSTRSSPAGRPNAAHRASLEAAGVRLTVVRNSEGGP
jgi:DeoR/GlpR family transcriptional regulator of sugar metabolism